MRVLRNKKALSSWLLALGFFFSIVAPVVSAADIATGRLDLTTSPLPINLSAKPGTSVSTDLRVKNSGPKTEYLKVELLKFKAYGDTGKPQLIDREPGDNYFDWVSFSQSKFYAEPNVWNTIKMTINVPKSAAFGYYYAITFSRVNPPKTNDDRQTTLAGGTSTLVLLEVPVPGAKRSVEVSSFTANRKFYEYLPVSFSITLSNTGQVHVAPSGTLFILRGNKQVAAIPINPDKGNVLPSSTRTFTASWADGFPVYTNKTENGQVLTDDKGQPIQSLKWDLSKISKLRIGKYTAKLVMVYDDGQRDVPIEGTLSFRVLPWKLLIILFFVLVLAGVGLWSTWKRIFSASKKISRKK
jgi:hypothetical protein